jgi:hypothetical protein
MGLVLTYSILCHQEEVPQLGDIIFSWEAIGLKQDAEVIPQLKP